MSERIAASLARLFEEQRIVFWYDAAHDMRADYDSIDLPDVVKLEIANNQFGLKYRILRQEKERKFLLYHAGPRPAEAEDWLLDLYLASAELRADQTAMLLAELGIDQKLDAVVREHSEFFRAKSRVEAFKKALKPSDNATQLRLRMLAVCANAPGGLDTVIEALLAEAAQEREEALKLVERCGLTGFLWKQIGNAYGYHAKPPGMDDFTISLFKACYAMSLAEDSALNAEAFVLFRRWKNDRTGAKHFETLAARFEGPLAIKSDLAKRDFRDLIEMDIFEEVDRHVIRNIVHGMAEQTVTPVEVLRWVQQRRNSHWYEKFKDIYDALRFAAEFTKGLSEVTLSMTSLAEGFSRYATTWFRLDQHYRRFIHHYQNSAQATLLGSVFERIENLYVNNFLVKLNDAWQEQINKVTVWDIPEVDRQITFYRDQVAAFRRRDQKVCVIISDALRYEAAEECLSRIRALDRFDAELKPMLGVLPSYTQLGMAALLPNKALRIAEGDSTLVFDGEQPTSGSANREKRLATGRDGDRVAVLGAEELRNFKSDQAKEFFRDHDVIYVYHNQIDAIGDKVATEDDLADAVEDTLDEIVVLVRKLTSANASNILITADHGFIYQHRPIEESDFSVAEVLGNVLARNRRFVLGKNLPPTPGLKKFTSDQLGLAGDLDIMIPNSINRLRLKGAGSRFVHGGASLQEIVVPVIRVAKRRESDVRQVDVQIISTGKNLITSGQLAVMFYQAQPVTDKVQPRSLRAGIFASNGELVSDVHDLTFGFKSENPRERELPRKFLLSRKADQHNNEDVFLRLEERVGTTSHFQEYASQRFQLRRGIATDFDF
ncbi:BREX-1 system phosphatase PglZ type A [Microvirga aerilata]|uniref:BREX-1 system phosphatase PglZ type A n=1 Tax=Microvirga aerilata TaxID=670292 RepID=A0A936Z7E7_9HYPH|nr:BREX-1 system phosphatase PglZ type A [Microvirga aerilata]MBL0403841.1 BREX-1 system phosphatase PglZ type A [Microvirga aerilata]